MKKIAIIDRGFISPYWKDLFARLNRRSSFVYTVFHSVPPSGTGLRAAEYPLDFPNVSVPRYEIKFLKGNMIYQSLMYRVLRDYDAIIISHELKFLSSMLLAVIFAVLRRPVIFWGFGYHAKRGLGYRADYSRMLSDITERVKIALLRLSSAYLAYTPGGAESLVKAGYPEDRIWVVRQTVNIEEQIPLYEKYSSADETILRKDLGLLTDSVVFLYIGRIVSAKQVPDLVNLTTALNAMGGKKVVESLIIGGGPEAEAVAALATANSRTKYLGEIYDQDLIASYLRVVDAVVLPGAGGITVTHAFAHGVPVLTRVLISHSPEVEYVEHGVNGLKVDGDFSAFVSAVHVFVENAEMQEKLAAGALKTRETLSLAHMVYQFDACVRSVMGPHRPHDQKDQTEVR